MSKVGRRAYYHDEDADQPESFGVRRHVHEYPYAAPDTAEGRIDS
jgi:hypothetical protein